MKNEFCAAEVWSIYGAFDVAPSLFSQLYTISVVKDHHILPIIYVLLKNKSKPTYLAFINIINNLISGLNPRIIITDFEKAALTAFSSKFPTTRLSGCLFHLAQNIYRKVAEQGYLAR
jgi:hypothetical protein